MEVFVLISESIIDMSDDRLTCDIFDSLEKAKAKMREEYDKSYKAWGDMGCDHEFEDLSAMHYLDGRYIETHIQWRIFKKEL